MSRQVTVTLTSYLPVLLTFCRHTVDEALARGASFFHTVLHFSIVAQLRCNGSQITSRLFGRGHLLFNGNPTASSN